MERIAGVRTPKILIVVAAMALLVSGCGEGILDAETNQAETNQAETNQTETNQAETNQAGAAQLMERIQAAMGELKYVATRSRTTITADSYEVVGETTETWMDLRDPQATRIRGLISESGSVTIELIVIGYNGWTRVGDSPWQPTSLTEEQVPNEISASQVELMLSGATIEDLGVETRDGVSARHFRATGGSKWESTQVADAIMAMEAVDIWLDSSDRMIHVEFEYVVRDGSSGSTVGTSVSVVEYFDFDVPIDIQPPV